MIFSYRQLLFFLCLLVVVSCGESTSLLDTSFGSSGIVTTNFGSGNDRIYGIAIQTDGKILAAGSAANGTLDFGVARYLASGELDTTFGGGDGMVTFPVGSFDDIAYAIGINADGTILVAGTAGVAIGDNDFAVARLTTDGTLDSTFGTGAIAQRDLGAGGDDQARALALVSGGRILLGGYGNSGTGLDFAVAAFTSTGAIDTAFGSSGTTVVAIGTGEDKAYSMSVQPDGKVVLAGSSFAGSEINFALARMTSSGVVDSSLFGTSGRVTLDIGATDVAYSVALRSNGRLVVSGVAGQASNNGAVVQFLTTGAIDSAFATSGMVTLDLNGNTDEFHGATLLPDGRLFVAGSSVGLTLAAALRVTGSFDLAFGTQGAHTVDISSGLDQLEAAVAQADGKVVVGGVTHNGVNQDFLLMRYSP